MAKRDEFTPQTKRILAERAGQRCANPDCGRSTAGPSDDGSGESTQLGKAAHITAAAEGGPRYDPKLSPEQRSPQENGIGLCAECAERVDKRENRVQYPVELLNSWKTFHESAAGTDFASKQNKGFYPVRKLALIDFAGVQGEAAINFGAFTIFRGTSKLHQTVGDLLRIFSDQNKFARTRQSRSGPTWNYGRIPSTEDKPILVTAVSTREPRDSPPQGKIKLCLSDSREFIVSAGTDGVSMSILDTPLPVFSSVIKVISIESSFHYTVFGSTLSDEEPNVIERLSRFFGISVGELKACIMGLPTDRSLFGYSYEIRDDSDLYLKIRKDRDFCSIGFLSSGEMTKFVLDMAIKIAMSSAKVKATILTIDQSQIGSLDQKGWPYFLEWVEREKLPFQVVFDGVYLPSEANLSYAMCYDVIGPDMAVTSFKQLTWNEFKNLTLWVCQKKTSIQLTPTYCSKNMLKGPWGVWQGADG